MSDFLTNLLARSFSQVGAVRPLFESTGASTRIEAQADPVLEASEEFSDPFTEMPVPEDEIAPEPEVRPAEKRAAPGVTPAPVTSGPEPAEKRAARRVTPAPVAGETELAEPRPEIEEPLITSRAPLLTPPLAATSSARQISAPLKETTSQVAAAGDSPKSTASLTAVESTTPAASKGSPLMRKASREIPRETLPRDSPNLLPKRVLQRRVTGEAPTANVNDFPSSESAPATPAFPRRAQRETLFSPSTTSLHSESRAAARAVEPKQELSALPPPIVPKTRTIPLPLNVKSRLIKPINAAPSEVAIDPVAPETVVHVAIGRIEVRATTPASTKRERRAGGPKIMTLDDYVQQRSRGSQ